MEIHITMNDLVTRASEYFLSRQNIPEARMNTILPATKYNLLAKLFNGSSVLLVAGVVNAVFLALTTSFVFLCIGLFLRFITEKELEKYTIPHQQMRAEAPQQQEELLEGRINGAFHIALLRHALHQSTEAEKTANIFQNVGIPANPNWNRNLITILDFDGWKNTIEIPEAVMRLQPPVEQPAQQQPGQNPAQAPNSNQQPQERNGLVHLVARLLGPNA